MIRTRVWTAGVAAVGLLLGATGCSAGGGGRANQAAGASGHVDATSWISKDTGWLVVTRTCAGQSCQLLLGTTDGGRNWTTRATDTGLYGAVANWTGVWLVSPSVGYLSDTGYDTTDSTLVTSDGGRSWASAPDGSKPGSAMPLDLAPRGGTVLRAAREINDPACPDTGDCGYEIQEADTGSNSWHTVLAPQPFNAGSGAGQVVRQSDRVGYAGFFGEEYDSGGPSWETSYLYRSLDGGSTWAPLHDPCAADAGGASRLAVGSGNRLAVVCTGGYHASKDEFLLVSTDEGATWGAPQGLPATFDSLTSSVALAGSTTFAVTADGVESSVDDGASWHPVSSIQPGTHSQLRLYGFNGSDLGELVNQADNDMWVTSDAGRSWTKLTVTAG